MWHQAGGRVNERQGEGEYVMLEFCKQTNDEDTDRNVAGQSINSVFRSFHPHLGELVVGSPSTGLMHIIISISQVKDY